MRFKDIFINKEMITFETYGFKKSGNTYLKKLEWWGEACKYLITITIYTDKIKFDIRYPDGCKHKINYYYTVPDFRNNSSTVHSYIINIIDEELSNLK